MGGMPSSLRQRRNRVHPEPAEGLQEPLLGDGETAGAGGATAEPLLGEPRPRRAAAEQRELPWPLAAVWHSLQAAWRWLAALLQRLLHLGAVAPPQLSLLQQERLGRLRQRAGVPYDADAAEHQAALRQLWSAAFPGDPFPVPIKHPRWKDMGWQGEDPGTDFRGAGFISLEALVWMAAARPATFAELMGKQRGVRAAWEYPFAAGGVNVAYLLAEVLELRQRPGADPEAAPASAPARGFLPLLAESESAFEETFVLAYRLLDAVWLQRKASYMEFPGVLKEVRQRLEAALGGRRPPQSLADLERALLPPAAAL